MPAAANHRALTSTPGSGVAVRRDGSVLTVKVTGQLDANSGVELLAGIRSAIDGATRIDVDLLGIAGFTPEGARSLKRSRALSGRLPDGLHFRIAPGVCQQALLEAFADDEPTDDDADIA